MNFFCSTDGNEVVGPYSLNELTTLFSTGALPPTTQVCREGQETWQPLSDILQQPAPKTAFHTPEASSAKPVSERKPSNPVAVFVAVFCAVVVGGAVLIFCWHEFLREKPPLAVPSTSTSPQPSLQAAASSPQPQVNPEQEQSLLIEAEKLDSIANQLMKNCFTLAQNISDEKAYGSVDPSLRPAVNKGFATTQTLRQELEAQLRIFKTKVAYMPKNWIGTEAFSALPSKYQTVLDQGDDPWKTPMKVIEASNSFKDAKKQLGKE